MQAQRIVSTIAIAAVLVGGTLVWRARTPGAPPEPIVQSVAIETAAQPDEPLTLAVAPAPSDEAVIAERVRELEAMSETYRNTTFVIAIRDAGYTCNELLRVYGGFEESGKWTATCSQMLAYTVGVARNGTLHVEPMNVYWDGVTRPVIQDLNGPAPRDAPPVVPPQR